MTIRICSAFDGGNITPLSIDGNRATLAIAADHNSEFYQWFYFRVANAGGRPVELVITNCADAAYPGGWPGYSARISEDRADWTLADTHYADGRLTITAHPRRDTLYVAYFAPYPLERHHDVLGWAGAQPGVRVRELGQSLDGRSLDIIEMGEGPVQIWLYARQHPGETMAQYWAEGVIRRLCDPQDSVARLLRARATIHIVPNMNPDGSARGHLRTNAAGVNLNREWAAPSMERSPEVFLVRAEMDRTGVDYAMDVHGDEAIPAVFMAGFEGVADLRPGQLATYQRFCALLDARTPDFQTRLGYPLKPAGKANLTMSTAQLAHRFGAVAMTLEMPFKDHDPLPDLVRGWSPARAMQLGRDCMATMAEVIVARESTPA